MRYRDNGDSNEVCNLRAASAAIRAVRSVAGRAMDRDLNQSAPDKHGEKVHSRCVGLLSIGY